MIIFSAAGWYPETSLKVQRREWIESNPLVKITHEGIAGTGDRLYLAIWFEEEEPNSVATSKLTEPEPTRAYVTEWFVWSKYLSLRLRNALASQRISPEEARAMTREQFIGIRFIGPKSADYIHEALSHWYDVYR